MFGLGIFLKFLLILAGFSGFQAEAAPAPLFVSPGGPVVNPASSMEFLFTGDGAAEQGIPEAGRFRPWTGGALAFGFTRETLWLHFRVQLQDSSVPDAGGRLTFLRIDYPLLDDVIVYQLQEGQLRKTSRFGDLLPYHQRLVDYRSFLLPMKLVPGKTRDIYIRVRTESSMQVPLSLEDSVQALERSVTSDHLLFLIYGALLIMIFYNLMVGLSTGFSSFFHYVIYVFCYLMFELSINGHGYQYIWSDSQWLQSRMIPLSILATAFFAISFGTSFMNLHLEQFRRPMRILQGSIFLMFLSALVLPYANSVVMAAVMVIIASLYGEYAALRLALRGNLPALYFLSAWSLFLFSCVVLALNKFDVLPHNVLTVNATKFGVVLEMLIFSLALAWRINTERHAKEMALLTVESNREETRQAKAIQDALISRHHIDIRGLVVSSHHKAAEIVGGDWFGSFVDESRRRVYLMMGDVNGHGLSAALITGAVAGVVKGCMRATGGDQGTMEDQTREIARMVNQVVLETGGYQRLLMSMAFVCVDLRTLEAFYLNAGHNGIFLITRTGTSTILERGSLLGLSESPDWGSRHLQLHSGDILFLYSDGLIENTGPDGRILRASRLKKMLVGNESPSEKVARVVARTEDIWRDKPLDDDCCVLAAGFKKVG